MSPQSGTVVFTQIAVAGVANTPATQCNWIMFGLDTSGRIWQTSDTHGWVRVEHPALLIDEPASEQQVRS